MGNFYVNFAVRGSTQAEVASWLRKADREAIVSPTRRGATFFFDRDADRQDEEDILAVAGAVSKDLGCTLLAVLNHDDDILRYWLFTAGDLVDEYNSCPDYATDGSAAPTGGNAVQLCSAFGVAGVVGQVEKALHHTKYGFAVEQHSTLAKLLGVESDYAFHGFRDLSTCLQNKRVAKAERIDPKQFVIIGKAAIAQKETGTKEVTIRELEEKTAHLPFFNWVGSDKHFHYFVTREGQRYKVQRARWQMPESMAGFLPRPADGMALFVTVKNGRIIIPDPSKMADLPDNELMPPDFDDDELR